MLADRKTDRQTDRHGHHSTPLPYCGRSNNYSRMYCRDVDIFLTSVHLSDPWRAVFTAQRNAMLARYVLLSSRVRPSVRPLQVGVLSKRLNESSWFLACELPLTYTKLCCKKIRVPPKIWVLPSRTLRQTLDFENFTGATRRWSPWITPTTVERVVAGCMRKLYDTFIRWSNHTRM